MHSDMKDRFESLGWKMESEKCWYHNKYGCVRENKKDEWYAYPIPEGEIGPCETKVEAMMECTTEYHMLETETMTRAMQYLKSNNP